ncbi:hypothetical protein FRC10_000505 [Ceratobasidium sp. 414]|nr:hypothetical protein FRC10_000505 [Ceratobasidium sp. 414]
MDKEIEVEMLSSPTKPARTKAKGGSVARTATAKDPGTIPHSTFPKYWQEAIEKTRLRIHSAFGCLRRTLLTADRHHDHNHDERSESTRFLAQSLKRHQWSNPPPPKPEPTQSIRQQGTQSPPKIMDEETFRDVLAMAGDGIDGDALALQIADADH